MKTGERSLDAKKVLARAEEIANGAPPAFSEQELRAALRAWLGIHRASHGPSSYNDLLGETTREAIDEVRAHLQAFPMPRELFESEGVAAAAIQYRFGHADQSEAEDIVVMEAEEEEGALSALAGYVSDLGEEEEAAFRTLLKDEEFAAAAVFAVNRASKVVAGAGLVEDEEFERLSRPILVRKGAANHPLIEAMTRFFVVDSAREVVRMVVNGLPVPGWQAAGMIERGDQRMAELAIKLGKPSKLVRAATSKTVAKLTPKTEPKKNAPGHWIARRMGVQWPGRAPGVEVEAIGVYHTGTEKFMAQEYVGESMDEWMEDNPDEDRDELESIYMREAEDWARSLNSGS